MTNAWQDIATAPRDGTWFLVVWTDRLQAPIFAVVMWDGDYWREADDIVGGFSHWMPLPEPPKEP